MLFVILLMGILMAIAWPTLRMLTAGSRMDTAANAVTIAAKASRTLSSVQVMNWDDEIPDARYDGTAMIFLEPLDAGGNPTTKAEIRLAFNNQFARDGANYLEMHAPNGRNGYADFEGRDPIRVPANVGIAGIVAPNGQLNALVDLPFAVLFNPRHQLVTAEATPTWYPAYYDTNEDGVYDTTPSPGNVDNEALHSAVGVVIYSLPEAVNAGLATLSSPGLPRLNLPAVTIDDLVSKAQGRVILFARYTGLPSSDGGLQ